VYQFIYSLFIPEGNYIIFLGNVLASYLDVVILLYLFFFYKDQYGKNESIKAAQAKSKKQVKLEYWGRFVAYVLFIELNIFLAYIFLISLLKLEESASTMTAFGYVAVAVATPFLIYLFQLTRRSLRINLLSIKLSIIVFIGIVLSFSPLPSQPEQKQGKVVTEVFSGQDLVRVINEKRKENKLEELISEPSACSIAKVRVNDIVENGVINFGQSASFQRSIDKAFLDDKSLDFDKAPGWYSEYITYQANLIEVVNGWNNDGAKDMFTNKRYRYACAAVKDGYGIVILGSDAPVDPVPENQIDPDYSG